MLPDGWRRLAVAEVCELQNGNGFEPRDWSTSGLPIIRIQNLNGSSSYNFFSGTPDPKWIVDPGQLLFAWAGTRGVSFGPTKWNGARGVLNQHIFKVQPGEEINPDWLHLALRHVTDRIESRAHGFKATLLHVKKSDIDRQIVLTPPLTEQKKIAATLATWDRAINVSEKLVEVSKAERKALLHGLLTTDIDYGRCPVRVPSSGRTVSVSNYPPSVQAGIPRLPATPTGWRRTKLSEHLFEVRRPIVLDGERKYALLTVKRSRGGVQRREILRGSEILTSSQFLVEGGDFLISKRQIVHGACGIVPADLAGSIVSNEYAVLRSNGGVDVKFLRYLSETRYFQQTCFHSSIGVHVEKMIFSTDKWLNWEFNIPPLARQLAIVKILDAASAEVDLLSAQLSMLRKEKRALMQQLLTGKRRVRVVPASAA